MIDMLKRHEIQVLRRAGHTLAEVAALSGASIGTVRRVTAEDAVTTVDNAAERVRRQVGRPSTAAIQKLADDRAVRRVQGAKRSKAPRQRWHSWHSGQCGLCNLQNLKGARETESLSLRQR